MDAQLLSSVMDRRAEQSVDADQRAVLLDTLATSPALADLARMLAALEPASQSLADEVGKARRVAHPQRSRAVRPVTGARHVRGRYLRWTVGIAASLAVAFGLSSGHMEKAQHAPHHMAVSPQPAHAVSAADRIFTSEDVIFATTDAFGGKPASSSRDDSLFRGSFAAGG